MRRFPVCFVFTPSSTAVHVTRSSFLFVMVTWRTWQDAPKDRLPPEDRLARAMRNIVRGRCSQVFETFTTARVLILSYFR